MGKRVASAKATRGVSKAKNHGDSSSSNPKTKKFRSQYNSLVTIAKGGPSRKIIRDQDMKKLAKNALEQKKKLDKLGNIDMVRKNSDNCQDNDCSIERMDEDDVESRVTDKTNLTTASFASVWSNCSNNSLNEFFQVWNPKLTTHKDALAVIAGLTKLLHDNGSEQSDLEFAELLFKIIVYDKTDENFVAGSLLALTFVLRKLKKKVIVTNFDKYYSILKDLMEKYHTTKKKTIVKCLLRCFSVLSKAHPDGKSAIEPKLRKKINIAIRARKLQNKINL